MRRDELIRMYRMSGMSEEQATKVADGVCRSRARVEEAEEEMLPVYQAHKKSKVE